MSAIKWVLLLCIAVLMSNPARAGEMTCGTEVILDDQSQPLTKQDVLDKCGEPDQKGDDRWEYSEQGKILFFNDDDELDTIEDRPPE